MTGKPETDPLPWNPQTSRSTIRFLVPLLHPECRDSRAGIDPVQRRPHVHDKFRHDRPTGMAHLLLCPLPHGALFLPSPNLRLRSPLPIEPASTSSVHVDHTAPF